MNKKWYLSLLSALLWLSVVGQGDANFTVSVSTDSVLLGNYMKVSFKLMNARGNDFMAPAFDGFRVVSGPNVSSSYSMVNGEVAQSVSYNYYLEPVDVGNYYILPASIETTEHILETEPVEILVVPNPDGIIQKIEPGADAFHFNLGGFDFPGFEEFQNLEDLPDLEDFPGLKDLPGLQDFLPAPEAAPKEKPAPPKKKKKKTVKI